MTLGTQRKSLCLHHFIPTEGLRINHLLGKQLTCKFRISGLGRGLERPPHLSHWEILLDREQFAEWKHRGSSMPNNPTEIVSTG